VRLVLAPRDALLSWAGDRFGRTIDGACSALGMVDDEGRIRAVVVFNGYTGENIEVSVASDRGLSRGLFAACADYVFRQLGCQRITATMRADDARGVRIATRMGFQVEGVLRRFYGTESAVVLGLLRDECRWGEKKR
jgi:hypothetical protein